jgi:hypothetical protein
MKPVSTMCGFMTAIIFLGSVFIGLALALILLVLLLAGAIKRIGYKEIPLDTELSSEEIVSRLEKELAARGKYPLREPGGLVLDDMVRLRVRIIEGASSRSIAFWAEPKDWLVVLELILLVVAFYIALIVGLVAYLRYDDNVKVLRSALASILPRDKWYYIGY